MKKKQRKYVLHSRSVCKREYGSHHCEWVRKSNLNVDIATEAMLLVLKVESNELRW